MNLVQPNIPTDFKDFWDNNTQEALKHPVEYQKKESDHPSDTHHIQIFQFNGIKNNTLNGWIAIPKDLPSFSKASAFIWLPHYGPSSVLPNKYGTRKDFISLSFNLHGKDPFNQDAYSKELGYFTHRVESKETWIFKEIFQNCCIATKILADLEEVEESKIASMGLSQGGGLAIWLGTWIPHLIKATCADLPFLAAITNTLEEKVFRYPTKEFIDYFAEDPTRKEKAYNTLNYYDTINIASQCKTPTLVSLGTKDPASKPYTVKSIYQSLPSTKKLVEYEWGHNWHPEMITNNLNWLNDYL